MQEATLFLAVSYFDRFLSVAKDVTPGMLQLVATACFSIAAKYQETLHPTPDEWVSIADDCLLVEDLIRMEFLVLHYLSWRVRKPTIYAFLHLYCAGVGAPSSVVKMSIHIAVSVGMSMLFQGGNRLLASCYLDAFHGIPMSFSELLHSFCRGNH